MYLWDNLRRNIGCDLRKVWSRSKGKVPTKVKPNKSNKTWCKFTELLWLRMILGPPKLFVMSIVFIPKRKHPAKQENGENYSKLEQLSLTYLTGWDESNVLEPATATQSLRQKHISNGIREHYLPQPWAIEGETWRDKMIIWNTAIGSLQLRVGSCVCFYVFVCFVVHESLLAPFAKLKSLFLLDCASDPDGIRISCVHLVFQKQVDPDEQRGPVKRTPLNRRPSRKWTCQLTLHLWAEISKG